MTDVMTAPAYGTVEHYAQHLREFADAYVGHEPREAWAYVERLAFGLVSNAARGSSDDARCLAEVRNILAAVAELKAERQARIERAT